jgi:L,D-transpeptidase ErfK/SrfK
MHHRLTASFAAALGSLWLAAGAALAGSGLPGLPGLVGELSSDRVAEGDTLLDVALRHRLGFTQVERLNPELDVWLPAVGSPVQLPTAAVLPDVPPEGLVINIPEMRLYDFTVGPEPAVFALGIGALEVPTPEGEFEITGKRVDPTWYVPKSILAERPELPAQVPPGPDNPLGDRWMTLSDSSYGIHGTNVQWSIGRLATHGCIRLYNDEMHRLYGRIRPGTPVRILYQTVKLGARDGTVYAEVHPDVYGRGQPSEEGLRVELMVMGLRGLLDPASIQSEALAQALREARGVPVPVARATGAG